MGQNITIAFPRNIKTTGVHFFAYVSTKLRVRQEKQRAREIAEAARRKALEADLLEKKEEEKARKRFEKIQEYKQKKVRKLMCVSRALCGESPQGGSRPPPS